MGGPIDMSYMTSRCFYKGKLKSENTELGTATSVSEEGPNQQHFFHSIFSFSDRKSEITEPMAKAANQ